MREIGAFDAKTHLSQFLDRADHGESFAITKHGRVVAFLIPAENKPKIAIQDVIVGMMALRKKIAKRGVKITAQEIDELKKSGRR
ncbi:MAG: type II toxin-antitoxin system prevent-host-death family antitoxin [Gammaproteobacteria bacterium]|nr:type II toxin-antitoxin system prevent-host-death family antitoxin [Gammaproteobacteria bacterium]